MTQRVVHSDSPTAISPHALFLQRLYKSRCVCTGNKLTLQLHQNNGLWCPRLPGNYSAVRPHPSHTAPTYPGDPVLPSILWPAFFLLLSPSSTILHTAASLSYSPPPPPLLNAMISAPHIPGGGGGGVASVSARGIQGHLDSNPAPEEAAAVLLLLSFPFLLTLLLPLLENRFTRPKIQRIHVTQKFLVLFYQHSLLPAPTNTGAGTASPTGNVTRTPVDPSEGGSGTVVCEFTTCLNLSHPQPSSTYRLCISSRGRGVGGRPYCPTICRWCLV